MKTGLRLTLVSTLVLLSAPVVLAAPDWIEKGTSAKYPADRFLIGIGNSGDLNQAMDRARGEIAKVIEAQIDQTSRTTEQYEQKDTSRGSDAKRTFQAFESVQVRTTATLEGVTIAETYREKDTHYALAVLDRDKTALELGARKAAIETEAQALLKGIGSNTAALDRAKALYRAWREFGAAEGYRRQILAIGRTVGEPDPALSDTSRRLSDALGAVKFRMDVKSSGAGEILDALSEALTSLGMSGVAGKEKEILLVKGDAAIERMDRGTNFVFAKWRVQIELVDAAKGESVGALSKADNEGSTTFDVARQKAVLKARQWISEEFRSLLLKSLLGGGEDLR